MLKLIKADAVNILLLTIGWLFLPIIIFLFAEATSLSFKLPISLAIKDSHFIIWDAGINIPENFSETIEGVSVTYIGNNLFFKIEEIAVRDDISIYANEIVTSIINLFKDNVEEININHFLADRPCELVTLRYYNHDHQIDLENLSTLYNVLFRYAYRFEDNFHSYLILNEFLGQVETIRNYTVLGTVILSLGIVFIRTGKNKHTS